MRNRIGLILLAATMSLPVFAQQAAPASNDAAVTNSPSQPAKRLHQRHTKPTSGLVGKSDKVPADRESKVTPDITKGGTTGAAAGVVPPPAKVDPELHNLNSVLPP